jgi:hypothetical protein
MRTRYAGDPLPTNGGIAVHTTALTDLAAPAVERMAPALDRVKPAVEQVRPALEHAIEHAKDHVPHHLPDHLTSHLPGGGKRCGRTARAKKAAGNHRGLVAVGLLALAGGVAGWFVMRRSSAAPWAPTHSSPAPGKPSAADSKAPASGFEQPDLQATGAPGQRGGYADRGADDGFGGAAIGGTAEASEGRYGTGSAEPLADGASPGAAYTIKGDEKGKTFHTRESPDYAVTTADVWFSDVEAARSAGFAAWDDK